MPLGPRRANQSFLLLLSHARALLTCLYIRLLTTFIWMCMVNTRMRGDLQTLRANTSTIRVNIASRVIIVIDAIMLKCVWCLKYVVRCNKTVIENIILYWSPITQVGALMHLPHNHILLCVLRLGDFVLLNIEPIINYSL